MLLKFILDASSIVHHDFEFAAPARGVRIYPWDWYNWICLRMELYGFYLSREICASSGTLPQTNKLCVGDRNCGQNAGCVKETQRQMKQGTVSLSKKQKQREHHLIL